MLSYCLKNEIKTQEIQGLVMEKQCFYENVQYVILKIKIC